MGAVLHVVQIGGALRRFISSRLRSQRGTADKLYGLGVCVNSSHWWGGGLPREGVVAEKFVPSLESLSSLGFEDKNLGCPWNFAGMSGTPGDVQKAWAKTVRAHFACPIQRVLQGAPSRGRQLYFTLPSAADPLFKASSPFMEAFFGHIFLTV